MIALRTTAKTLGGYSTHSYMNEGCPLRAHRSLKRYAKGDTYSIQVNQAGTTARLMKNPENSENGMIKNVQTRKAVTGS